MFSKLVKSFLNFSTQQTPNAKMITKMAQKIEAMKITMNQTSPRSLSLFFILTTLPTFYFGYKIVSEQYSSQQFTQSTNNIIKYYYIKNILLYSCGLTLWHSNFVNPTGKYTVHRTLSRQRYYPIIFSILGLFMPPIDSKYVVLPAIFTDFFTLSAQAFLTNEGALPFWYFSFRHHIRYFQWFVFIMVFVALYKFQKRIISHPHQFTVINQQQKDIKKQQKTAALSLK